MSAHQRLSVGAAAIVVEVFGIVLVRDGPGWVFGICCLVVVTAALTIIDPNTFKLKGGGVEAELTRKERDVQVAAGRLARSDDVLREVVTGSDHTEEVATYDFSSEDDTAAIRAEIGARLDALEPQRRAEIEDLITESAEWGWLMARLGFKTTPRPVIEWRDGEPLITSGTGDPSGPRGGRLTGTAGTGHDLPGDEI